MSELDSNKLRRLDVTLLLIFLGVLRHGKASMVASELGLTAPSISHALGRLRDIFDDPLFLRRPHGLEPTAFARGIEPDIRKALGALQSSLSGPAVFDPHTSQAHIRLSARDSEVASTLPDALCRLFESAPQLTLSLEAMTSTQAIKSLMESHLDVAIGYFPKLPEDVVATELRVESYLVTGRASNPLLQQDLTLQTYLAADHLLVATDRSLHGIVDDKLSEGGKARHVALSIPQFMPALAVLSRSDMIATLPARLVEQHADRFGLSVHKPPLELRSYLVRMVRHKRELKNPAVTWCHDQIFASF